MYQHLNKVIYIINRLLKLFLFYGGNVTLHIQDSLVAHECAAAQRMRSTGVGNAFVQRPVKTPSYYIPFNFLLIYLLSFFRPLIITRNF